MPPVPQQVRVRSTTPHFPTRFGLVFGLAGLHWPLAFALYLPSGLLSLITSGPLLLGARHLPNLGPWITSLTNGGNLDTWLHASGAPVGRALPRLEDAHLATTQPGVLLIGVLLALVGLLVQGFSYTLLTGGVLERLGGAEPRGFWGGCRRWFRPLLRFGLPAMLLLGLGGLGLGAIALIPATGATATLLKTLASFLWLSYLNGVLELARAQLVIHGDSPLRALRRALILPCRPGVFLHATLLWLFLLAAGTLYWTASSRALLDTPATALLVVFGAQQLVALLGAWLKVVRYALAVELARTTA
jgi:hypothetical protein